MPRRDENDDGITDTDYESLGTEGYTQYDPAIAGTWLASFTGDDAKRTMRQNESARRRQDRMWQELRNSSPTAEDLAVDYGQLGTEDEWGDLLGGDSQLAGLGPSDAQRLALERLQGLSEGGFTDADRAMMRASRTQNAQALGANQGAVRQQMEARGMGGSGLSLAAQLGGGQQMANANALAGSQQMMGAQQRALQALQGYTGLANTMQSQEMARRQALDAWNQQQLGWRRGRDAANVGLRGRTGESAAQAQQTAYGNRERTVFGQTGQSQQSQQQRNQDAQRLDAANDRTSALIGSGVQGITSGITSGVAG